MGRRYRQNRVLLVTDCCFKIAPIARKVTVLTACNGTIHDIIKLTDENISSSAFKTVLIGGLFWVFFQKTGTEYKDPIPLASKNDLSIPELAELIVSSSERWRTNHEVNVLWAMPVEVEIFKFNKDLQKKTGPKFYAMTHTEDVEARSTAQLLQRSYFKELVELVQQADVNSVVNYVELDQFLTTRNMKRVQKRMKLLKKDTDSLVMKALYRCALVWKPVPTPPEDNQATSQSSQPTLTPDTCLLNPDVHRYALRVEEDLFGDNMNDTMTDDEILMLLGISNKELFNESTMSSISEQPGLCAPPSKNESLKRSFTQMIEETATIGDVTVDHNRFNGNSNLDTYDKSQLAPISFQTNIATFQSKCVSSNTSSSLTNFQSNKLLQGILGEEETSCPSPDDGNNPCDDPPECIEEMLCGLGDSGNSVSSTVDRWTQIIGTPPKFILPPPKLPLSSVQIKIRSQESTLRYYKTLLTNKRESSTQTPITRRKLWRRRMRSNYNRLMDNVFQALHSD